MIIKQGKEWLVKDSSGKKILGRHSSKEKARKQLAAIEISKQKKLNETNLLNLFLKILQENLTASIPQQAAINSKNRNKNMEEEIPPQEKYYEAEPFHGMASHGLGALAQRDIVQKHYDNPETEEVEQADEVNWQTTNAAVSNYVGDQVNQLMRQQRMMG